MNNRHDKMLFWGCFIALITTSTAFITRAILVNTVWPVEFGLDKVQAQELFGAGIWPFAISIILFSLVIDKVGYKAAMWFSAICYAAYAGLALMAYGAVHAAGLEGEALAQAQAKAWDYLYAGSVILGLGNGTVEAFINPVVATLFSKEKTKWLNILHAGWPAGLVAGGVLTILLSGGVDEGWAIRDWRLAVYLLAIPAAIYLIMLTPLKFPVQERVASGTTYKEMLGEFGVLGAALAGFLVLKQFELVFTQWDAGFTSIVFTVVLVAYGVYTHSLGKPLLLFLCLVMMPLATTELGTDAAITGLLEEPMAAAEKHPAWVLVYTSAIMMVLRFFAGPLVKVLSPLGLLASCAALAVVGLNFLAVATGVTMIFLAATLYGVGKTYFWPTMLGVVSEQCPKGGALTINAIAGIGMLTVGIIGGPLIGRMQEASAQKAIERTMPGVYSQVSTESSYFLGKYRAVDQAALLDLSAEQQVEVQEIDKKAKQGAFANISVLPAFMLVCYLAMVLYFKRRGGYKAVQLAAGSR